MAEARFDKRFGSGFVVFFQRQVTGLLLSFQHA